MAFTAKEKAFIQYVKNRCKEHGVKCDLRNTTYLRLSATSTCSGYFSEAAPELVVAMKSPRWIGILAHEYSHLTQWVERIPVWVKAENSLQHVWDWIDGTDIKGINRHINVARDLELDNEQRAVNIIQRFDLNVDIDSYIRRANAYVQYYNWIKQTRKWSKPGNTPYSNERLIAAMPNKFNMDYSKIPKRIERIFREENI